MLAVKELRANELNGGYIATVLSITIARKSISILVKLFNL